LDKYQPLIETAYALIKEKYSWYAKAQAVAEILQETGALLPLRLMH
jgi:hypothetical protein